MTHPLVTSLVSIATGECGNSDWLNINCGLVLSVELLGTLVLGLPTEYHTLMSHLQLMGLLPVSAC